MNKNDFSKNSRNVADYNGGSGSFVPHCSDRDTRVGVLGIADGKTMKAVTRYQCEFCKKDFKTPDRHQCKKDPALKNCFTCKNLKGWLESDDGVDVGVGFLRDPNYPDCTAGVDGWNIEDIKSANYDMQCEGWEERE